MPQTSGVTEAHDSLLALAADTDVDTGEGNTEAPAAQANSDAALAPADDVMQDILEEDGQLPGLYAFIALHSLPLLVNPSRSLPGRRTYQYFLQRVDF